MAAMWGRTECIAKLAAVEVADGQSEKLPLLQHMPIGCSVRAHACAHPCTPDDLAL
jgi:hypothetical protein